MNSTKYSRRRFLMLAARNCLILAFAAGVLTLSAACTCAADQKPKSPHWGKVSCAHCRMAVGDKQAAAQLIGPGYRTHYYDDLGCAIEHLKADPSLAGWKLYMIDPVPGLDAEKWVPADSLRYEEGHHTPMGHGFVPSVSGSLGFGDVQKKIFDKGQN